MDNKLQEEIAELFAKRFSKFNEKVLHRLGKTIKEVGELIPSDVYRLSQQLKYNTTIEELMKELSKITGQTIEEVEELIEKIAKDNLEFASTYYKAKKMNVPVYNEHEKLKRLVKSIADMTQNNFVNIARSTGFRLIDWNGEPMLLSIEETYHKVIDEAVYAITTGKESYNTQMKDIITQLSDSGVRKIEYESGYSRRIDTSVRMNVLDAMRQISNESQKLFGEEYGADGIEVSVHSNPAPDHEEVQGHQFSLEEFDKFQNDIDCHDYKGKLYTANFKGHDRRSISEYNCYHYIFSIVLGVSRPLYSDKELQQIIDTNHKGVEIDGKKYTMYEATQLQRKIETQIRREKETQIIARASSNDELVDKSQQKITNLMNKYKEISKTSGLNEDLERLYVPKYKSVKIKNNDVSYLDITKEWSTKYKKNSYEVKDLHYFEDKSGVKYRVDGKNVVLDYSMKEKEVALWLSNNIGGEIYMLPKVNKPDGIKTADYLWNDELWDLKEINGNGKNILFHAIEDHEQQSHNFIFDVSNSELSNDEVLERLNKLYKLKKVEWLDKVIVKKNHEIIIIAQKSSPSD